VAVSMQSSVATLKVSTVNCCPSLTDHNGLSHRTSPSSSTVTVSAANTTSPVPVPSRSTVVQRLSNDLRVASMASCGRSVATVHHYTVRQKTNLILDIYLFITQAVVGRRSNSFTIRLGSVYWLQNFSHLSVHTLNI